MRFLTKTTFSIKALVPCVFAQEAAPVLVIPRPVMQVEDGGMIGGCEDAHPGKNIEFPKKSDLGPTPSVRVRKVTFFFKDKIKCFPSKSV